MAGLARELGQIGHRVEQIGVGLGQDDSRIPGALAHAQVIVAAGGDGTVHHAAAHAIRLDRPLYHYPMGNENLFAREFGMDRRPSTLAAALERMRIVRADVARVVEGSRERVVLMFSVGADASVIHRLERSRQRATGRAAYLAPIMGELMRPCFPRITVIVDGTAVVAGRRGEVMVANCRQYALRTNPAWRASMTDGLLDMVFLPCTTAVGCLVWAARAAARRLGGAVNATGRTIRVEAEWEGGRAPVQVDGEAAGFAPFEVTVERQVLPVLACA